MSGAGTVKDVDYICKILTIKKISSYKENILPIQIFKTETKSLFPQYHPYSRQ